MKKSSLILLVILAIVSAILSYLCFVGWGHENGNRESKGAVLPRITKTSHDPRAQDARTIGDSEVEVGLKSTHFPGDDTRNNTAAGVNAEEGVAHQNVKIEQPVSQQDPIPDKKGPSKISREDYHSLVAGVGPAKQLGKLELPEATTGRVSFLHSQKTETQRSSLAQRVGLSGKGQIVQAAGRVFLLQDDKPLHPLGGARLFSSVETSATSDDYGMYSLDIFVSRKVPGKSGGDADTAYVSTLALVVPGYRVVTMIMGGEVYPYSASFGLKTSDMPSLDYVLESAPLREVQVEVRGLAPEQYEGFEIWAKAEFPLAKISGRLVYEIKPDANGKSVLMVPEGTVLSVGGAGEGVVALPGAPLQIHSKSPSSLSVAIQAQTRKTHKILISVSDAASRIVRKDVLLESRTTRHCAVSDDSGNAFVWDARPLGSSISYVSLECGRSGTALLEISENPRFVRGFGNVLSFSANEKGVLKLSAALSPRVDATIEVGNLPEAVAQVPVESLERTYEVVLSAEEMNSMSAERVMPWMVERLLLFTVDEKAQAPQARRLVGYYRIDPASWQGEPPYRLILTPVE